MRHLDQLLTLENWDAAPEVNDVPVPSAAGEPESLVVGGLEPGTDYYFAIRSVDDSGNWSDLSNSLMFTTESTPPVPTDYKPLTEPDNVIHNLEESYRRREVEPYAELLAPEFRFVFQPDPGDPPGTSRQWNRNQDSTGTGNLFRASEVTQIRIELLRGEAAPATEAGLEHTMKIRVLGTFLDVDLDNGTTLRVSGDVQDYFVRRGDPDAGEDERWYLVEWRDISGAALALNPEAEDISWGQIKNLFD